MPTPTVTAVGRLLRPTGDEPRILHRIAVAHDGDRWRARTIIRQQLPVK